MSEENYWSKLSSRGVLYVHLESIDYENNRDVYPQISCLPFFQNELRAILPLLERYGHRLLNLEEILRQRAIRESSELKKNLPQDEITLQSLMNDWNKDRLYTGDGLIQNKKGDIKLHLDSSNMWMICKRYIDKKNNQDKGVEFLPEESISEVGPLRIYDRGRTNLRRECVGFNLDNEGRFNIEKYKENGAIGFEDLPDETKEGIQLYFPLKEIQELSKNPPKDPAKHPVLLALARGDATILHKALEALKRYNSKKKIKALEIELPITKPQFEWERMLLCESYWFHEDEDKTIRMLKKNNPYYYGIGINPTYSDF